MCKEGLGVEVHEITYSALLGLMRSHDRCVTQTNNKQLIALSGVGIVHAGDYVVVKGTAFFGLCTSDILLVGVFHSLGDARVEVDFRETFSRFEHMAVEYEIWHVIEDDPSQDETPADSSIEPLHDDDGKKPYHLYYKFGVSLYNCASKSEYEEYNTDFLLDGYAQFDYLEDAELFAKNVLKSNKIRPYVKHPMFDRAIIDYFDGHKYLKIITFTLTDSLRIKAQFLPNIARFYSFPGKMEDFSNDLEALSQLREAAMI